MKTEEHLRKMREDWDQRARENARYFIADSNESWTEEEFYASGETTVANDILTDMWDIQGGREPKDMRVLEIGCGAGRVTRALAKIFGEVHGVDVSGEMLAKARHALRDTPNAQVHQTDGQSLAALDGLYFHFAYSCCVFHHISSYEIIRNYVREVGRLLVPGALFKFEVQGYTGLRTHAGDTWFGVPFSEPQARAMAEDCGFEMRYQHGLGEERYWLWFFKKFE